MFVAAELVLDIGFRAAHARLVNLAHKGGLSDVSQAAFRDGLPAVLRVGPFGAVPGASKLVRVRLLDPVYRRDAMTLGLRWEATGFASELFPMLDADISVTPAGERRTRLALIGSYRAPLGGIGSGLDRAVLSLVAVATIHALLRHVADTLAAPGMAAAEQPGPLSFPGHR
jgi:hypothetical protein